MKFKFSEESIFVIKNWEIIQKLINAEGEIKKDFPKYFNELKKILQNKEWWNNNLKFELESDQQAYISIIDWKVKGVYVIWIGVEWFIPENLFGPTGNAICYLWVEDNEKITKIVSDLRSIFKNDDTYGEYIGTEEGYVIKKSLKKYEPDEIDDFINGAPLEEIATFIGEVYLKIKDYRIPQ